MRKAWGVINNENYCAHDCDEEDADAGKLDIASETIERELVRQKEISHKGSGKGDQMYRVCGVGHSWWQLFYQLEDVAEYINETSRGSDTAVEIWY